MEETYLYNCINCKEEWECTDECENYICPFCSMPVTEMIHDIYKEEGIWGVITQLWKRYF